MGTKKRIQTMYDQRNGVPLTSLGDKIYKAPEYMPGFYKDGGLVVGSTYIILISKFLQFLNIAIKRKSSQVETLKLLIFMLDLNLVKVL